jgi:hypothetical protein
MDNSIGEILESLDLTEGNAEVLMALTRFLGILDSTVNPKQSLTLP